MKANLVKIDGGDFLGPYDTELLKVVRLIDRFDFVKIMLARCMVIFITRRELLLTTLKWWQKYKIWSVKTKIWRKRKSITILLS